MGAATELRHCGAGQAAGAIPTWPAPPALPCSPLWHCTTSYTLLTGLGHLLLPVTSPPPPHVLLKSLSQKWLSRKWLPSHSTPECRRRRNAWSNSSTGATTNLPRHLQCHQLPPSHSTTTSNSNSSSSSRRTRSSSRHHRVQSRPPRSPPQDQRLPPGATPAPLPPQARHPLLRPEVRRRREKGGGWQMFQATFSPAVHCRSCGRASP
jgi:hypothetical protein